MISFAEWTEKNRESTNTVIKKKNDPIFKLG